MQVQGSDDPVPRSVAIVGNAPGLRGEGERIDAADWVVRFNNAAGFGAESGRRVTHLALVNHGGQMREWLDDPAFVRRPVVRMATSFLFPFALKSGPAEARDVDGRDWTREALALLSPLGAEVVILPDAVRDRAEAIVRTPDRPEAAPSTGFLVALHLLEGLPATTRIVVHGFGFAGWRGHNWQAERGWFEAMRDAGRLEIHVPDA